MPHVSNRVNCFFFGGIKYFDLSRFLEGRTLCLNVGVQDRKEKKKKMKRLTKISTH